MKKFLVAACAILALALVMAYQSPAQAPTSPDLGETNLLLLACGYMTDVAEAEGLQVRYCRRHQPEEVNGAKAKATVTLGTDAGRFVIEVEFQKSLWWATSFGATPVG
jgi:hypothetical protein